MCRRLMLAAAVGLACSPVRRTLTPDEAAAKIRDLAPFREPKTFAATLVAPFTEPVTILNRMGFIASRSTAAGDFFFLTQTGKRAAENWSPRQDPEHPKRESYIVPLATRELVNVESTREDRGIARADIVWRYRPNEIGRAMALDSQLKPATVYFRLRENTWAVDESNLPMF